MRIGIWIARSSFAFTVVLAGWHVDASKAKACSCLPPTVESSYQQHSDVVRARVVLALPAGSTTLYLARVRAVYKGCLTRGQYVVLTTPSSSAACGVGLSNGSTYLVNGDDAGTILGLPGLSIGLCDYNPLWSALSEHDHEFLDSRTVCCGDSCACADGTAPVNCFVDPCQVAPPCPDGECVANYCGGCNAEFYDAQGYAVCDSECESGADCVEECEKDSDCMRTGCSGEVCAAEPVFTTCQFLPEYACYHDPEVTTCGCQAGRCEWNPTDALRQCIDDARGGGTTIQVQ